MRGSVSIIFLFLSSTGYVHPHVFACSNCAGMPFWLGWYVNAAAMIFKKSMAARMLNAAGCC